MPGEAGALYPNWSASVMSLLPTALHDEAVPLLTAAAVERAVLCPSLYPGAGICPTPPLADLSYSVSRKILIFFPSDCFTLY